MSYCEVCMCTEASPCVLPAGTPCAWADPDQTICTACIPELEHLEGLDGCRVCGPGTVVPAGWGPLLPELGAVFEQPADAEPELVLSWGSGSKDAGSAS
jgi:hypothetical protein